MQKVARKKKVVEMIVEEYCQKVNYLCALHILPVKKYKTTNYIYTCHHRQTELPELNLIDGYITFEIGAHIV